MGYLLFEQAKPGKASCGKIVRFTQKEGVFGSKTDICAAFEEMNRKLWLGL